MMPSAMANSGILATSSREYSPTSRLVDCMAESSMTRSYVKLRISWGLAARSWIALKESMTTK